MLNGARRPDWSSCSHRCAPSASDHVPGGVDVKMRTQMRKSAEKMTKGQLALEEVNARGESRQGHITYLFSMRLGHRVGTLESFRTMLSSMELVCVWEFLELSTSMRSLVKHISVIL